MYDNQNENKYFKTKQACFPLQCNYLIPACACITLLHVFKVPAYSSDTNFPAVVCLFLLYG